MTMLTILTTMIMMMVMMIVMMMMIMVIMIEIIRMTIILITLIRIAIMMVNHENMFLISLFINCMHNNQYWHDSRNETLYAEASVFIAEINNEKEEQNEDYAANLAALENFVMVKFTEVKNTLTAFSHCSVQSLQCSVTAVLSHLCLQYLGQIH